MSTHWYGWRRSILCIAAAVGISLPLAGDAGAHWKIVKLKGGLTTEAVECATFCTAGPFTGGLAGTLEWTMDVMNETSNPDVVTFVGVNTITTAQGTLSGTDYGIWNIATGDFVDITHITSGTGIYAGARGTLTIIGGFDAASGTGSSNYVALLKLD